MQNTRKYLAALKLLLDTFIHPPIQLVRRYTKRVSHHRASNDISWEFETQDNVEFDDPSEEHEAIIIEDEGDDIQRYLGDSDFSPQTLCDPGNEPLTFEYKQKAVKFWKSGKTGNYKLSTVKTRFKKLQSITHLMRCDQQINQIIYNFYTYYIAIFLQAFLYTFLLDLFVGPSASHVLWIAYF
ncbi:hypothetical protein ABEB36_014294 [Hypothenemus hampei]|uniref:Uncharacterized protein n=1 Tax=Hypothenemus hampei TaxID=57062 RepID=A0ABD1E635_HYPHA